MPPSVFPEDTEHQRHGHCLRSDHCIGTAASQPWPLGPTSHTQSVLVATPSTEKLHFSCSCALIFSVHNHQSFWLSLAHHSRVRMLGQTEPVRTRSLVLGWWGQVGINCLSYAISCSSRRQTTDRQTHRRAEAEFLISPVATRWSNSVTNSSAESPDEGDGTFHPGSGSPRGCWQFWITAVDALSSQAGQILLSLVRL